MTTNADTGLELEKTLRRASELAELIADEKGAGETHEADYQWLYDLLYDLRCKFSEEGTTNEQDSRLKKLGLPCLQDQRPTEAFLKTGLRAPDVYAGLRMLQLAMEHYLESAAELHPGLTRFREPGFLEHGEWLSKLAGSLCQLFDSEDGRIEGESLTFLLDCGMPGLRPV